MPHDLGVLSHFDAVVWYLGDNRLTQDPEDATPTYLGAELPDLAVAERQQYLTIAMRDYLNEGGKLSTRARRRRTTASAAPCSAASTTASTALPSRSAS